MFSSLYIHVPFCDKKCDYCAFFSLAKHSKSLHENYLHRLEEEFKTLANLSKPLTSIFIGGGTPTTLSFNELKHLLQSIKNNFTIENCANPSKEVEFTIECNPESLTEDKISLFADFAVNRISLGIQTFNPTFRKILGRKGSLNKLDKIISQLTNKGINNINFDLIYNIPGQSLDDWHNDLKKLINFPITHCSAYSLSIDEDTKMAKEYDNQNLNDDISIEMWKLTQSFLTETKKIYRYEISNYAKVGMQCKHNYDIWFGGTYLGCGPAASSFDGEIRFSNISDINLWLKKALPEKDIISRELRAKEIFIIGLRCVDGWGIDDFYQKTGFSFMDLMPILKDFINDGFLSFNKKRIKPREKGLLFADYIARTLL